MEIEIGLGSEKTAEIAEALNILLADEHVLYVKTRNAYWNIDGRDFLTIHRFFGGQYKRFVNMLTFSMEFFADSSPLL